ncbi:MAG TPA: Sec-independent protein translocase TatB [Nakamurella sp.]
MFGLSWGQIGIIVLIGVFVLGPERIPTVIAGAVTTLGRIRTFAAGAQADTVGRLGPEIAELRRQLADLQSLPGLAELRELHPKHAPSAVTPADLGPPSSRSDAVPAPTRAGSSDGRVT